jgi:hypothetical protein
MPTLLTREAATQQVVFLLQELSDSDFSSLT